MHESVTKFCSLLEIFWAQSQNLMWLVTSSPFPWVIPSHNQRKYPASRTPFPRDCTSRLQPVPPVCCFVPVWWLSLSSQLICGDKLFRKWSLSKRQRYRKTFSVWVYQDFNYETPRMFYSEINLFLMGLLQMVPYLPKSSKHWGPGLTSCLQLASPAK